MIANNEFAICHVWRHGNVNSIQNPSTVTNPTCNPIVLFCHSRCRAVQRDKLQTHYCVEIELIFT